MAWFITLASKMAGKEIPGVGMAPGGKTRGMLWWGLALVRLLRTTGTVWCALCSRERG